MKILFFGRKSDKLSIKLAKILKKNTQLRKYGVMVRQTKLTLKSVVLSILLYAFEAIIF